jgi:VIT1/CCC1 family predicted Fe2+/Mn2+ transporter
MSDGLTVPFVLAAGLSGALLAPGLIVFAGLVQVTAGALTMGLGGYYAGKENREHNSLENGSPEPVPASEKEEMKSFLSRLELSDEVQARAMEEMVEEKRTWQEFVKKYELGQDLPDEGRARKDAIIIGLSYVAGGIIPLSSYFFAPDAHTALKYSALVTLVCLFIFGYFRSRLTGQNALHGGFRVMLTGAVAAGCAYGIVRWIEG